MKWLVSSREKIRCGPLEAYIIVRYVTKSTRRLEVVQAGTKPCEVCNGAKIPGEARPSSSDVLKRYGTPRIVTNFHAAHGLRMSESMRYKRERVIMDDPRNTHLPQALITARRWDDCDYEPIASAPVSGAHWATIVVTAVSLVDSLGPLSRLQKHWRQGEVFAADIVMGRRDRCGRW